jgi:hypothetical protein
MYIDDICMEYDTKIKTHVMHGVLYAHACTLVLCVLLGGTFFLVLLAHTVFLLACYIFGVIYSISRMSYFGTMPVICP